MTMIAQIEKNYPGGYNPGDKVRVVSSVWNGIDVGMLGVVLPIDPEDSAPGCDCCMEYVSVDLDGGPKNWPFLPGEIEMVVPDVVSDADVLPAFVADFDYLDSLPESAVVTTLDGAVAFQKLDGRWYGAGMGVGQDTLVLAFAILAEGVLLVSLPR